MAEAGAHDCENQKQEISELLKRTLKKGDTWYLIDTKWYKQWKKYVGYDSWDTSYVGDQSAYPGPIDNTPLLKEGGRGLLREHLIDELDYMLVPEEAWNKLVNWYSIAESQEPIPRQVIEQGMFVKHAKVEVYLLDLKLCQNSDMDTVVTKNFSRADTIDHIEKEMRLVFEISKERDVRLWNKYMTNTYEHLTKLDSTVQDVGLYPGQIIVIEPKNEDGTWPRPTRTTGSIQYNNTGGSSAASSSTRSCNSPTTIDDYSSSPARSSSTSFSYGSTGYGSSSSSYYSGNQDRGYGGSTAAPGLCGLSNLGNTCFMNSALQCMSNVPLLTEYMLNGRWKRELNQDNPLGNKGEIASSYAELVENIWSGKYSYTIPRNFKMAVGRFAPQFSGYQQQDSQELMAFLLDGLHEDLNRIQIKPYVEQKDANGRSDEVVAQEAWGNYKKRNDSVIVDTFHGQLKSTLVCPECNKISVTFDPFCYLSLPLPYKKERHIEVFLIPYDPMKKPRQYKLNVPKMGVVSDLCQALSKATDIPPNKMIVADVYNHRFHKMFTMDEGLNHILDRDDIFVYEVSVVTPDDPDVVVVPVYLREQRMKQTYSNYNHATLQLFGQPLLVPVPRKECTYETLYKLVLARMERYVKTPEAGHEWWREDTKDQNGEVEMSDSNEGESSTAESSRTRPEPEEDDQEGNSLYMDQEGQARLFKFSCVNSYGSAEMDKIKDDGKAIKLSSRSYLAVDWHHRAKELFYDDKVAEDLDMDDTMSQRPVQKKQAIQLTECLDLFMTAERLGEQDPWYCPQCKKHQQATKKFDLWDLPNILVIHLKRFSYNRYWRDKLDTLVEFPTRNLNMGKWIISPNHPPATYDLIGVSNHYGGLGGGHYTAYALNKDSAQWYHFDDSSVSRATDESVVTKAGYVLVYQRRSTMKPPTNGEPSVAPSAAAGAAHSSEGSMAVSNGSHGSEDDMEVN